MHLQGRYQTKEKKEALRMPRGRGTQHILELLDYNSGGNGSGGGAPG